MIARFEDFFSSDNIIACLCRERLASMKRLHEDHYLDHLAPRENPSLQSSAQEILGCFPPRRRWYRPPKSVRGYGTFRELQSILMFTVRKLRYRNDPVDRGWIQKQDCFIGAVKFRALSAQKAVFTPPRISPSAKDGRGGEYRILAAYSLEDKILIGQCAAYLRALFEGYFLPCSFAFRYPTNHMKPPTHHDAFSVLARFWSENQKCGSTAAWAAECDIQGFFDTVCHQIFLREFDQAIRLLAHQGQYVDARSRVLILAYLRSYSHAGYAVPEARAILARYDPCGTVSDRSQALEDFHENPVPSRIGIPQGGALSCFIANLMLHKADEAVMNVLAKNSANVKYVRYCDDMVIVGESLQAVREAVTIYCEVLKSLKLPTHELKSEQYGPRFWKTKSKSPYRWGKEKDTKAVPWLAFVGYQLRFDGMIRIRPSSINRELKKQANVTSSFLAHVLPALEKGRVRRNWYRMLASLKGRLEAMSVGRRSDWDFEWSEPSECWSSGFKCISLEMLPDDQKIVRTQLRRLDRGRGKQLARAKRRVSKFSSKLGTKSLKKRELMPYSGKPKSYSGQF